MQKTERSNFDGRYEQKNFKQYLKKSSKKSSMFKVF